ncbi:neuronal membrane glycoprotein M6-a [Echinops telfairi]|uniref:Neuronal membrane glycoprotein M6-a n=1 Tax=Echinops telfairi TaxID=9371 RepID=A0AC55CSN7_ECHTE|nr:neuronal membrane glycoprotein M6-a [Echinops telfairi]
MEENMEEGQTQKGCFECCIKCLGGIPYASLIATILLYAGVALFCGCGHEALSGSVTILQTYFEMARTAGDTLDVFTISSTSPSSMPLYRACALLLTHQKYMRQRLTILASTQHAGSSSSKTDLFAPLAVDGTCIFLRQHHKSNASILRSSLFSVQLSNAYELVENTKACVRNTLVFKFIMLTYLFMLAWLGVTVFTSLPVYMYFNLWTICRNTTLVEGANLCLDLRPFGIVTIGEEKKICTVSENFLRMCESTELNMTFHLFIVALAGAGAAVIAMVHYLMVLSANWAYVKDACRMQKYEDIKSKEEQELHDIHSTRSKERLNAYT